MNKGKKITGGIYHRNRKKKLYEIVKPARAVKLGKQKTKTIRARGDNKKKVMLSAELVNVYDPKTKVSKKVKIKNVLETPPNRFLARQNVLVKSAIIETELGRARITNRPSREGSVQAVLIG